MSYLIAACSSPIHLSQVHALASQFVSGQCQAHPQCCFWSYTLIIYLKPLEFKYTSVVRWSKPGSLEITVSSHPTQQSLLQLTGLTSPPEGLLVTTVSGSMVALTEVHSIAKLRTNSAGAYVFTRLTKDCYTLHICLGDSELGQALKLLIW